MTGFAYPEMMVGVCAAHAAGDASAPTTCSTPTSRSPATRQQAALGLAVRKHLLARRGAIASPALRRPGARLSPADIADTDLLVARQERRLAELG